MTDTLYDYDTDTSQCAYCFSEAPCGYDHPEEEDGVPPSQNQVLNELETAEAGHMTTDELVRETGCSHRAVTAELVRLEAKGLVRQLGYPAPGLDPNAYAWRSIVLDVPPASQS